MLNKIFLCYLLLLIFLYIIRKEEERMKKTPNNIIEYIIILLLISGISIAILQFFGEKISQNNQKEFNTNRPQQELFQNKAEFK